MVFNCMQSKELISPRVLLLICDLHRGASEHARECPRGCPDVSFSCSHPYSFELITGLATNRTVISGLRHPIPAAAACGLWTLSRFVYTVRYGAGDPKKVCFILNAALANKSNFFTANPAHYSSPNWLLLADW